MTIPSLSVGPQRAARPAATSSVTSGQTRPQDTVQLGANFHRQQAYQVMDQMIAARDPVTGLLPLHVETRDGHLVATDHMAAGLDMGRATSGLVMTSEVAARHGDEARAQTYLQAAEANYEAGKQALAQGDIFVQRRDFNADGSVKATEWGEPGKSATGEDNMSRINPRGYAFRGAADLYLSTGKREYKEDFNRYFQASDLLTQPITILFRR